MRTATLLGNNEQSLTGDQGHLSLISFSHGPGDVPNGDDRPQETQSLFRRAKSRLVRKKCILSIIEDLFISELNKLSLASPPLHLLRALVLPKIRSTWVLQVKKKRSLIRARPSKESRSSLPSMLQKLTRSTTKTRPGRKYMLSLDSRVKCLSYLSR